MGLTSYDATILAHANIIHYWTLNSTTNDSKGSNHMSGGTAGTYVDGIDGDKSMLFNGTTHGIGTASAIDVTATNKVTLMLFQRWAVYDTTNSCHVAEMSTNGSTNNGGFVVRTRGDLAGDPHQTLCTGNVGSNSAQYNQSTFGFAAGIWYHMAYVYDFSQAANECDLYINGAVVTPDTRPLTTNNTGNFDNTNLYLGARNNGASLHWNGSLCKVALFNTALSSGDILSIYNSSRLGLANIEISSMALKSQHKLRVS